MKNFSSLCQDTEINPYDKLIYVFKYLRKTLKIFNLNKSFYFIINLLKIRFKIFY